MQGFFEGIPIFYWASMRVRERGSFMTMQYRNLCVFCLLLHPHAYYCDRYMLGHQETLLKEGFIVVVFFAMPFVV